MLRSYGSAFEARSLCFCIFKYPTYSRSIAWARFGCCISARCDQTIDQLGELSGIYMELGEHHACGSILHIQKADQKVFGSHVVMSAFFGCLNRICQCFFCLTGISFSHNTIVSFMFRLRNCCKFHLQADVLLLLIYFCRRLLQESPADLHAVPAWRTVCPHRFG